MIDRVLALVTAIVMIFAAVGPTSAPRPAPNAGGQTPAAISATPCCTTRQGASGTVSEQAGAPLGQATASGSGRVYGAASRAATTRRWKPALDPREGSLVPAASAPHPARTVVPPAVRAGSPWHTAFASSYGIGDGFLGGHLACGGILTATALIVANRTLPCGTRLEICFTRSGGTYCSAAVVRDRGPYVAGRDFDLGPAVARGVHFAGLGLIRWRLTA